MVTTNSSHPKLPLTLTLVYFQIPELEILKGTLEYAYQVITKMIVVRCFGKLSFGFDFKQARYHRFPEQKWYVRNCHSRRR